MAFPSKRTRFSSTRIEVFVPATNKQQKMITRQQFAKRIDNTSRFLNKNFGGSTKVSAEGSFVLKSGKLVKEPIAKVESFVPANRITKEKKKRLNQFLARKTRTWGQEAVAVKFESRRTPAESIHFIEPNVSMKKVR